MAPITQASDESNHQELLDKLDIYSVSKRFRNPAWKAAQRRNKNVRQIIAEAARRSEASTGATQDNSGTSTPVPDGSAASTGAVTPAASARGSKPDLDKADQNLAKLAIENRASGVNGSGPAGSVTYTNIESAPSFHPSSQKHYCDITGLPAPYTDPKSRLRYHNGEMFGVVRTLGQHPTESYLAARGAHTVLK